MILRRKDRAGVAAVVFATLLFAAAACSSSDSESAVVDVSGAPIGSVTSTPDETEPAESGESEADPGADSSPADDAVPLDDIDALAVDLNDYWTLVAVELDFDYEPIPLDRVTTGTDGAVCSGEPIDLEELADNAYVDPECDEGITVAYDPDYLGASVARAEATMAHEWGHVVQAQAEHLDISFAEDGLPVDAELQADCFAGAWAADRAQEDIELLREDTADAGDTDDVELDDPDAHGLPEERVIAFDVGLAGGPAACLDELLDALP